MGKRLLLMRHARIATEYQGKLIGSTDVPLDDLSHDQTQHMADRIMRWHPQICVSSPMRRCRQTAAVAAAGLPLRIDNDLREIDFGLCETRTFTEAMAVDAELAARWAAFAPEFGFPGGEKVEGFLGRVRAAADRLVQEESPSVLALTHGGVIRTMICHFLGLEARHYLAFDVPYSAIAVIDLLDGRGVLVALDRPDAGEVVHG